MAIDGAGAAATEVDPEAEAVATIEVDLGEAADLVWAPGSALLLFSIFDSSAVAALQFAKEFVPGTDILPVASLAFLLANVYPETQLAKVLGLGEEGADTSGAPGGGDPPRGGH